MLKINSYLDNSQDDDQVESTVIVESDNTNISVDTTVIKYDNNDVYMGTVVHDNFTCSEVSINTVVINANAVVKCSQIFITNKSNDTIKWAIVSLTGEILYTTKYCHVECTCTIDLDSTTINPHTKFKLKALIDSKDNISSVVLEFCPRYSQAANFMLKGTRFKSNTVYLGTSVI